VLGRSSFLRSESEGLRFLGEGTESKSTALTELDPKKTKTLFLDFSAGESENKSMTQNDSVNVAATLVLLIALALGHFLVSDLPIQHHLLHTGVPNIIFCRPIDCEPLPPSTCVFFIAHRHTAEQADWASLLHPSHPRPLGPSHPRCPSPVMPLRYRMQSGCRKGC
jgi:hypothetical protein